MPEDVYQILKDAHPKLVADVLDKSYEISNCLMLFYSHIWNEACTRRENPADLTVMVDVVLERLLRVRAVYIPQEGSPPVILDSHPVKRNISLARLLAVNKNVRNLAVKVVEVLEQWVNEKLYRKRLGIFAIRLENSRLWKGNFTFTSEIVLKTEFDELVKAKMKWVDEEDLLDRKASEGGLIIQ